MVATVSSKPSPTQYAILVSALLAFSVGGGYFAGSQPAGTWRYFSWHPFLMTCGMVGFAGIGAVTKKLGGYSNTKIHGFLGFLSVLCNAAGLYVIYNNKNAYGFDHLKTYHSQVGLVLAVACFGLGAAGSAFLHPDFGVDKTNKTIRYAHKTGARVVLAMSWITAMTGLWQLVPNEPWKVALYGGPLLLLLPFTLL
jgi:hypothetical protein